MTTTFRATALAEFGSSEERQRALARLLGSTSPAQLLAMPGVSEALLDLLGERVDDAIAASARDLLDRLSAGIMHFGPGFDLIFDMIDSEDVVWPVAILRHGIVEGKFASIQEAMRVAGALARQDLAAATVQLPRGI